MQNVQTRDTKTLKRAYAIAFLTFSLGACTNSPQEITKTAIRCPPVPADIVAESKRAPRIAGKTAVEVAGRLVKQVVVKNRSLRRIVKTYEECRA